MARLIWWNPVRKAKKSKARKAKTRKAKTRKSKARKTKARKTKTRKSVKRSKRRNPAISASDAAALRRILKKHGY